MTGGHGEFQPFTFAQRQTLMPGGVDHPGARYPLLWH